MDSDSESKDVAPFETFQKVLGFLASIGLATVASGAFSLATAQSVFGDTSATKLSAARDSAILLSWASACFILALTFIVGTQLLYSDPAIRDVVKKKGDAPHGRFARVIVAVVSLLSLGLQGTALFLLGQSLGLVSSGPVKMVRYGIVGGVCLTVVTGLVVIVWDDEAKKRYCWFFGKIHCCSR